MKTKTTLGVEALDARNMPSITLVGGVLTINGFDDGDDVASVSMVGGQVQARLTSYGPSGPLGTLAVTQTASYSPFAVDRIIFRGYGGDDQFTNNTGFRSTAYGGAGFDNLIGGSYIDVLDGGGNNDHLQGNGGGDVLYGGSGRDWMFGGNGSDILWGGSDGDWLYGNDGLDTLDGGTGADYLNGGIDGYADTLFGGNPEGDWFVAEEYSLGFGPVNRDEPQDATDPTDVVIW